jgi:hypothetical protein
MPLLIRASIACIFNAAISPLGSRVATSALIVLLPISMTATGPEDMSYGTPGRHGSEDLVFQLDETDMSHKGHGSHTGVHSARNRVWAP